MLMTSISCISNIHLSINISALYWVSERHKEKDSKRADLRSLLNALRSPLTLHYCCHTHTKRFMCPSSPLTEFIKDGISGLVKVTASSVHSHTWAAFGKDKKELSVNFFFFGGVGRSSVHLSLPRPLFFHQISTFSMENSHFLSLWLKSALKEGGGVGWKGVKNEPPSALRKTWEWSINLLFSICELYCLELHSLLFVQIK